MYATKVPRSLHTLTFQTPKIQDDFKVLGKTLTYFFHCKFFIFIEKLLTSLKTLTQNNFFNIVKSDSTKAGFPRVFGI